MRPGAVRLSALSALTLAALVFVPAEGAAAAGVTYRSASGTCRTASLYANYSTSRGPKDPLGTVVSGEVVGYQYTDGSWAVVRTVADQIGFVLRNCITVPAAGTSGSYLWPAKATCQDATLYGFYNAKTHKPHNPIGTLRAPRRIGYQYFRGLAAGPWAVIRKGTQAHPGYGYVLRECIAVAKWAPKAAWHPAP